MNDVRAAVDFYRDIRAILKREKERRQRRQRPKPPPVPSVERNTRRDEQLRAYRLFMLDRISSNAAHRKLMREAAQQFDALESRERASRRKRKDTNRGTIPPMVCGQPKKRSAA